MAAGRRTMRTTARERPMPQQFDVVVVGAGFSGLYALHQLRGAGFSVRVLEAADDVGGTWYWNRYPGARCDIPTTDYTYSFDPELENDWKWSEKYATQPEILAYLRFVADRYGLRPDIDFGVSVRSARWDEEQRGWVLTTDRDEELRCRFYVMASGCLSVPKESDIEGADRFAGAVYRTARWPHEPVDFTGKRVAVIGTGSSGIQSIPLIARQAAHLAVFQRTPNFSMPARNQPLDASFVAERKASYAEHRQRSRESRTGTPYVRSAKTALSASDEEREAAYRTAWGSGRLYEMGAAYVDLMVDEAANQTAAEFVRARIREIVEDPEVAERLCPRDHPFGTKRPCLDTDYYATFNRHNVELVDVRSHPIVEVTASGIRTAAAQHDLDVIVFATGFDAMTGPLLSLDVVGRGGATL